MAGKSKGKHKFHSVLTAAADVDNKSFGYDFASLEVVVKIILQLIHFSVRVGQKLF